MRTTNPFLLSVGIHLTLVALIIGALSVEHKTILNTPEKISLKILLDSPKLLSTAPIVHLNEPIQERIKTTPQSKIPEKPIIQKILAPAPIMPPTITPQTTPIITPSALVTKAESLPISVPKAPPPETKEEYKYPHKNEAQSILKQNIVCTKNMKRLKLRGVVFLSFDLSPEGEAKHITITQSSGSEFLDKAVEQQIKTLAPLLPKPAETVPFSSFSIEFKQCQ